MYDHLYCKEITTITTLQADCVPPRSYQNEAIPHPILQLFAFHEKKRANKKYNQSTIQDFFWLKKFLGVLLFLVKIRNFGVEMG